MITMFRFVIMHITYVYGIIITVLVHPTVRKLNSWLQTGHMEFNLWLPQLLLDMFSDILCMLHMPSMLMCTAVPCYVRGMCMPQSKISGGLILYPDRLI